MNCMAPTHISGFVWFGICLNDMNILTLCSVARTTKLTVNQDRVYFVGTWRERFKGRGDWVNHVRLVTINHQPCIIDYQYVNERLRSSLLSYWVFCYLYNKSLQSTVGTCHEPFEATAIMWTSRNILSITVNRVALKSMMWLLFCFLFITIRVYTLQ